MPQLSDSDKQLYLDALKNIDIFKNDLEKVELRAAVIRNGLVALDNQIAMIFNRACAKQGVDPDAFILDGAGGFVPKDTPEVISESS